PSQVYTNVALLTRVIDFGLELQRAIDAPRWFVTPGGDLQIETSVVEDVRARLAAYGHRVVPFPPHSAAFGGAGIVRINESGTREAGADPRRETYALAY
ncbi:MAG: gamma-glutamyltransferase, partial [Candidatus Eremiobacteraeota bacterium]|nr:gamma-glutamyltransferase [Candidatus Eremiobacteraeota bacterium]